MESWIPRYRRSALGLVWATAFAYGLVLELPTERGNLVLTIAMAWAILIFCALDARSHGKALQRGLLMPLVMTWPLSIAVHLVWTRGRRGFLTYLWAILLVALFVVLGVLAGAAVRVFWLGWQP